MVPHIDVPITDSSQVGEARRAALRLATENELDETTRGRVALVVTELGTNLLRHAQGGRLLIGCKLTPEGCQLEIVSIDRGPGIADIARCLQDGFSTGGTPGTGLGAVQRLASDFSIFSMVGQGTVILARTWTPSTRSTNASSLGWAPPTSVRRIAYAGLCLAAPGETVSGDGWGIHLDDDRATVMVADGLGHGPEAAAASDEALRAFAMKPGSPKAILEHAHQRLRSTRGAAVSIASLDLASATVTFAGAGNVSGRLISGVEDRTLLSQHGTIGIQIRTLQDVVYPWPEHAIVVLFSDGITSRWNLQDVGGLLQCDPAVIAGWILRDHTRGHDDITIVVLKRG
jgi:anti-sigma regulatory factor (Ser/Thr protein kinase)